MKEERRTTFPPPDTHTHTHTEGGGRGLQEAVFLIHPLNGEAHTSGDFPPPLSFSPNTRLPHQGETAGGEGFGPLVLPPHTHTFLLPAE